MNATRKTGATGTWWVVSLLLVAWGAAPVWAEDDGGAPPPQPVENQVPPVQPKWEQLDNPLPGQTKENSYVHPETGDIGVYMNQQGQVISQEQFLADQERFKNEAIIGLRRVMEGGSGDLNINVSDDVQVQEAVNASRSALEKQEAAANADLQRQREEAKRYVPARTLRSFEANSDQGQ